MMGSQLEQIDKTVRLACEGLAWRGLVHAYGHCSQRIDAERFLASPGKPLGLVTNADPCVVVPVDGPLPDGVLGEVRIHQAIYRRRPEIGGVVRFMGPSVMALGALAKAPKARHGFGSYFAPEPPVWLDPQLVRDDQRADGVAALMGGRSAIILRGNGAVTVGPNLETACVFAFYLDDACRVELEALRCGLADASPVLSEGEARQRATTAGQIVERMWSYLTTRPANDAGRP